MIVPVKPGPSDKATPYDNHPANQKGETSEAQALICWLRLVTERNDCDNQRELHISTGEFSKKKKYRCVLL